MLSLVEVTCPHCGVKGRVILPSLSSIIIGPCPQCQEFLLVFCGRALAVAKEAILTGSAEERREYLMTILTEFLRENIERLIQENGDGAHTPFPVAAVDDDEPIELSEIVEEAAQEQRRNTAPTGAIAQEEIDEFVKIDLHLLDNGDYFKAIFS